ncbi:MAG: DUF3006 domain-containing protein [Myxococcales bacterium]
MRITNRPEVSYAQQPEAKPQTQKACIDRFEKCADGRVLAVILVGDEERSIDVPREQLPAGAKEGDWLQVVLKGDKLVSATIDVKETEARRQRIQDLFESVFEQPKTVSSKACIDRFEKTADGKTLAVLLVGDEEKIVNVPLEKLPAGVKEGDWLQVELKGDELTAATVDKKETEDRRNFIQKLLDLLFGRRA